jgi:hypothetical protein
VFTVPIADLVDPSKRSTMARQGCRPFTALLIFAGVGTMLPVFDTSPRIWGLTAFILAGVLNSCVFPELAKL